MARAFEAAKGGLADRMLAALDAAQSEGGDSRGRQSVASVVATCKPTGKPWTDRIFGLRVDDSPEPLRELRRLVILPRAYDRMNAGVLAVGKNDHDRALTECRAAAALVPDNAEMAYWHAVSLVNMEGIEESLPLFRRAFAKDRNWVAPTRRLAKVGQLHDDDPAIRRILGAGDGEKPDRLGRRTVRGACLLRPTASIRRSAYRYGAAAGPSTTRAPMLLSSR